MNLQNYSLNADFNGTLTGYEKKLKEERRKLSVIEKKDIHTRALTHKLKNSNIKYYLDEMKIFYNDKDHTINNKIVDEIENLVRERNLVKSECI